MACLLFLSVVQFAFAEQQQPLPDDMRSDARLPLQWRNKSHITFPKRVIVEYQHTLTNNAQQPLSPAFKRWSKELHLRQQYDEFQDLKTRSNPLPASQVTHEYSHLPMSVVLLEDMNQLQQLLQSQNVRQLAEDQVMYRTLAESRELIQVPDSENSLGQTGAGSAVVVLDSGVDYTHQAFGSCTAVATPASCRVVVAMDLATDDGLLDDDGHGTNVSAIVAGVASDADLIVMDVFDGEFAYNSDIIAGINWAIANQPTYNIAAINMSFGGSLKFTSPCSETFLNPYRTPVINARVAGIVSVSSSGNDGFLDGLTSPACTPEVVSVGAIYDSNNGSVSYEDCSDSATAADQVTCFSNTATFLDFLAPGAFITAGGYSFSGTSQASPHVAALAAILHSAYPQDTADQIIQRMMNGSESVLDTRVGQSFPRINALSAVGAINDSLNQPLVLQQPQAELTIQTINASKEPDEPNHLGFIGGKSVWFRFDSTEDSQLALSTEGSSFDTVLAVYTGDSINTLELLAENDDNGINTTSELLFHAAANNVYFIVVDDKNGVGGTQKLNYVITASPPKEIPALPLAAHIILMICIVVSFVFYSNQQFVFHPDK